MADVNTAPHSIELEQQLIGAVLANNDRYHMIGSMVSPGDFFEPVHGIIWRHIASRVSKDHIASPATMKADLEGEPGLAELGGPKYLANLVGFSVSGSMVKEYARELIEIANRRRLIDAMGDITARLNSGSPAEDAVAALELLLADQQEGSSDPRSMSLLKAHTNSVEQMIEDRQSGNYGVTTGIPSLDEAISLRGKRYSILAGATSMGKTALGVWIAKAAAEAGYGVGFVTLEMGEEDLANRISSIDSQIPYKAYDRPMSDTLMRKVVDTARGQEALPIEIMSAKVRDIPAILSEGKRLKHRWSYADGSSHFKGFKLLVIDYIQLVRGRGSSEFHILSQVANDLKQVAKQLDVHVLALAQLDRKIGDRDDPRPRLSDLRGSGDLENAPDNVMFIYRPEYYLERQLLTEKDIEKKADLVADMEHFRGKAEIIISKARMADIGVHRVNCDMATNRFWDEDNAQGGMGF